jgi:hypothetical protein
VYNTTELNEIPSLLNKSGQQQVHEGVQARRKKKVVRWHTRPEKFSQVKGSKTARQATMVFDPLWRLFGMATPEEESEGRSTENWPRFIPAFICVDQIVDAPTSGGRWPEASDCKALKDRIVVGCFNESLASILKEALGRALAANWTSNGEIDVKFAFSAQSMKDKWRRKNDDSAAGRQVSSPTADAAHGNFQNSTPSRNGRMDLY